MKKQKVEKIVMESFVIPFYRNTKKEVIEFIQDEEKKIQEKRRINYASIL